MTYKLIPITTLLQPLYSLQPANSVYRDIKITDQQKDKIDINIIKNSDSKLSSDDIRKLRHRIDFLTDIYNIILKHLCIYKQKQNNLDLILDNIIDELNTNQMTHNYLKEFCLSNTNIHGPRNPNNDCIDPMFSKENLLIPINEILKDSFLGKVCIIKSEDNYNFNINIIGDDKFGGNFRGNFRGNIWKNVKDNNRFKLINLNKLLEENIKPIEKNTLLCIQINNKYICTEIKKNMQCNFCEKWVQDRIMFRNVINDLLYANNIDDIFNIIKLSSNLLPSVIFEQKEYHYFNTALEQFKLSKNL